MPTRHYTITRAEAGTTLGQVLCQTLALAQSTARRLVQQGKVKVAQVICQDWDRRVFPGERLEFTIPEETRSTRKSPPQKVPPASLSPLAAAVHIQYVDDALVVVDKPAHLTTARHDYERAEFGEKGQRYLPKTLADLLPGLLPPLQGVRHKVRAVHRLDKETSGLVVFARTVEAESHLGGQFRAHTTERLYLALVRGEASDATICSHFVEDRGDGRRGSHAEGEGQLAITHVRVLERLGSFSFVECRLETGRTHQVRIHLGEAGTPLCGERLYDRPVHGRPLADESGAARIALHATTLGFTHPVTGERLRWVSPLPDDLQSLLEQLRKKREVKSDPPS